MVLGAAEVEDEDGTKIKLIKLRNPWGRETYKGPFSDMSKKWSNKLKEEVE